MNLHGEQPVLVNKFNPQQKQPKARRVTVDLPEQLDLDENYEETVTNLTNVRRASDGKFRLGYLNFDRIRQISPSAALLLASEVDRWNARNGGRVRARHTNWNPNVKRLFCQMGLFELLGLPRPTDLDLVANTTFLPFQHRDVVDNSSPGATVKELRVQLEGVAGVEIKRHLLFEALSEAGTNVSQHAYHSHAHLKRWWLFASYEKSNNTIVVSLCDHGLTIPGTLPSSGFLETVKDKISLWNDGEKIKAAMELGRSKTGALERGKGLQNFLEIIKTYPGSRLRIFSNHGLLTVSNSASDGLVMKSSLVETPFLGTLIEWQFVPKTTI
ncbi:MAG TPA: hypothetical protein VNU49_06295 [Opitutaceae bacterium]|nr:hypothetical protein [Opitutaceae bacterium]